MNLFMFEVALRALDGCKLQVQYERPSSPPGVA